MNSSTATESRSMNFADRKKARIAAGTQSFFFEVWATYPIAAELGKFKSKREAIEFAFGRVGKLAGNSAAMNAVYAKFPKRHISTGQSFVVERVNKMTGERCVCRAD